MEGASEKESKIGGAIGATLCLLNEFLRLDQFTVNRLTDFFWDAQVKTLRLDSYRPARPNERIVFWRNHGNFWGGVCKRGRASVWDIAVGFSRRIKRSS